MTRRFSPLLLLLAACGVHAALDEAHVDQARNEAQTIRQAAELALVQDPRGGCPTVEGLTEARILDEAPVDPWSHPYTIACEGTAVTVRSGGPDGVQGTADDIRVE